MLFQKSGLKLLVFCVNWKQIDVDNGSMLVLYYLCSQYYIIFFLLLQVEMYFC